MIGKAVRLLAVAGILAGTFWVGEAFLARRADAEVYQFIRERAASLLDFDWLDGFPGPRYDIALNGTRNTLDVSSSRLLPTEILDALEARAEAQLRSLRLPEDGTAVDYEVAAILRRPFRLDGPGWGVFARLFGGTGVTPMPWLENLKEGRGPGAGATGGFIVLARRDQGASRTAVWTIRFDENFNPLELVPKGDGDAPGVDVPEVRRYPGTRRTVSMVATERGRQSGMFSYEGRGSIADHARHFAAEFRWAGFQQLASDATEDGGIILQFRRGAVEASVFVGAPADDEGDVIDLITILDR